MTAEKINLVERARIVLRAAGVDEDATWFTSTATGTALLALLCNARAKVDRSLYAHKSVLVASAIIAAKRGSIPVWRQPHQSYGEYPTDTVVYVETEVGRMAFHVRSDDAVLAQVLTLLPWRDDPWSGKPLQPIAAELARQWVAQQRYAF